MVKLARQYSRAVKSSNLKCDDEHFDTDTLAAMALSGEHKLGSLLFRVKYANDASSHVHLFEQWSVIVHGKSIRAQWPKHIPATKVAELSLAYWLSDVCPVCTGRGHPVILNTPSLEENECQGCRGTGKKPLECEPTERSYIENAIDTLETMILRAGDEAMRKLARDMDT